MKYYQTFTVTGSGHFPFDMLRYDSCWPRYEREICELTNNGEIRHINIARMVASKATQPTSARWESFGWKVNCVSTIRL